MAEGLSLGRGNGAGRGWRCLYLFLNRCSRRLRVSLKIAPERAPQLWIVVCHAGEGSKVGVEEVGETGCRGACALWAGNDSGSTVESENMWCCLFVYALSVPICVCVCLCVSVFLSYIYIHMCVCVCVCLFLVVAPQFKEF